MTGLCFLLDSHIHQRQYQIFRLWGSYSQVHRRIRFDPAYLRKLSALEASLSFCILDLSLGEYLPWRTVGQFDEHAGVICLLLVVECGIGT